MRAEGYGLLLVMLEPSSEIEEEFNEWYDSEHIPERLLVPGFLSSERYIAQEGSPKYLSTFDLESPEVLKSDEYRRVGPDHLSPWGRRIFRYIRGVKRNVYEQIFPGNSQINNMSNGLLLVAEDVDLSKEKEVNQWYIKEHIPRLKDMHLVLNVRRFVSIEGSPKYLTLYELEELESLSEANFKKALKEKSLYIDKTENVIKNVYKKYQKCLFDHITFFKQD